MTIVGLKGVVNKNFVTALTLAGPGRGSAAGAGAGEGDAIDVSLQNGARSFAAGFQALNIGISYLNNARAAQEKILGLVDRLELLVSQAGKSTGVGGSTSGLRLEFDQLQREFRQVVEGSTVNDQNLLNPEDLAEVLRKAGLDPEGIDELTRAFRDLTPIGATASNGVASGDGGERIRALVPVEDFTSALRQSAGSFDEALDEYDPEVSLAAFRGIRDRLRSVRREVQQNISSIDQVMEVVSRNMDLTRAVGRSLLDMSLEVRGTEEVDALAADLRTRIRRLTPQQALGAVSNLEAIRAAGLELTAEAVGEDDS